MYGLDISSYQAKIDLSIGNYDFAIIKATEGIGFTDRMFNQFAVQLTKLNKLIGCYHFARPDLNGTIDGMKREAKYFCEIVTKADLMHNSILVLDWETEPMDRPDLITAWVKEVEYISGVTPFIYGSKSKLSSLLNNKPPIEVLHECPIWMAAWPSIQRFEVGINPGLTIPSKTPVKWNIWQYSSIGKYPSFNGNIDLDYTDLTKQQWMSLAGSKEEEEYISPDMEWCIQNGIFGGYPDGTYRPNEPLTRGQAATVIHRLYNKIMAEIK